MFFFFKRTLFAMKTRDAIQHSISISVAMSPFLRAFAFIFSELENPCRNPSNGIGPSTHSLIFS